MIEKSEDRRLSVHRRPDWSVEELLPGITGSAKAKFADPQARFNYERAIAQREFEERLASMKGACNPGIAAALKTNTDEWGANSLALWAHAFIETCLKSYADRLRDEDVPLDDALMKFDVESARILDEMRGKIRLESPALGLDEDEQRFLFDSGNDDMVLAIRKDFETLLCDVELERPYQNGALLEVETVRAAIRAALKDTPGFQIKIFVDFAGVTEDQFKQWHSRGASKYDQKIRSAAKRWLAGER